MSDFELNREVRYAISLGHTLPSRFLHRSFRAAEAALMAHPGKGWDALTALDAPKESKEQFVRARREDGMFALSMDVVVPKSQYPVQCSLRTTDTQFSLHIDDAEALAVLHDVLSGEWEQQRAGDESFDTAQELLGGGVLVPRRRAKLTCDVPGIYRLQHASLLFRSESTCVVADPVCTQTESRWLDPRDLPHLDGILLSHSHGDHFCLMTLMQFPRDITIIVPHVEQPSMLCPDMASLLRGAGFTNVIAAPWYSKHTIGDITIHAYPFYGEQPWLSFAEPLPGLRNVGNTYVVEQDGLTSWVLIDSGSEYGNSMTDVCARVRAEVGEIDVVFSNLREFRWHAGQIDGSGRYLFCFPIAELLRPERWPVGQMLTFGALGMRDLLLELEAKHFFPYAHWWHSSSTQPHIVDGVSTESEMVARIAAPGLRTELHTWNVGNRLTWKGGTLAVQAGMGTDLSGL